MMKKPRFRGTAVLRKKMKKVQAEFRPERQEPESPEPQKVQMPEQSKTLPKRPQARLAPPDMIHCWTPSETASRRRGPSRLGPRSSSAAGLDALSSEGNAADGKEVAKQNPGDKRKDDRSLRWEAASQLSATSSHRKSHRLHKRDQAAKSAGASRGPSRGSVRTLSSREGAAPRASWDSDGAGSDISESDACAPSPAAAKSSSFLPVLPNVQAVRTTSNDSDAWSGHPALRSKWMSAKTHHQMQKGTVAERLRKVTSARLSASKGKVQARSSAEAPNTQISLPDVFTNVQTMLAPNANGLTQWEQRNNYLRRWCQSQGIRPRFESYGPEDVGAIDAIWDSLPDRIKDVIDRDEFVQDLLPDEPDGSNDNHAPAEHSEDRFLPRSMTPQKRPIDMARSGKVKLLPSLLDEKATSVPQELELVTSGPQAITITRQDLDRLSRRISKEKSAMQLSHYLYGHDQIYAVNHLLTIHTSLTRLELANNDLRDSELKILATTLKGLSCSLQEIDLSNNCLTYHSCMELMPIMRDRNKVSSKLRTATMGSVALMRMAINSGSGFMAPAAPQNPVLRELNLSGNPIGNKAMEILQLNVIGHGVYLKKLDLSNCKITATGATYLGEFIGGNKTVEELKIGWNTLGYKGCRCILDAVQGNVAMKVLDLSWCGLGEVSGSAIVGVLKANTTLKKINLSGNNLGDLSAVELGNALRTNRTLEHVILHTNPIGWQGARKLLQAAQYKNIKAIELCHCHLLRRPNGAAEFDPRQPWGPYTLDLSKPQERVVAVQLAELCYNVDQTGPGDSVWKSATVDGKKFILGLVEPPPEPEEDAKQEASKSGPPVVVVKEFNLPETGILKLELRQIQMPVLNKGEEAVSDQVLEAMWNKSIGTDTPMSDEWKLSLLDVLCADYFFTVSQMISIMLAFQFPREQVRAVSRLFARLVDPSQFQRVEQYLPSTSQDNLRSILGVNVKYNPKNPTGRYDLILSSQVDNMIAWRLLNEYKAQNKKGLCCLNDNDYMMRCWSNPVLDGKKLTINRLDDFSLPSEGLLTLTFLDLRLPGPDSQALPEFNFRCLLGYLSVAQELDTEYMCKFLGDQDLLYRAEHIYKMAPQITRGDAPGVPLSVRDKVNAAAALRQALADVWLTCDQTSRLVAVCNKSGLIGPAMAAEVAVLLWSRCIDRSEWNIVINKLDPTTQVKVCRTLGYGAAVNTQNPNMHYVLRLFKSDELQVAKILHGVACKLKGGSNPYRACTIFYPDDNHEDGGEWVSLEEAINTRVRDWSVGMSAVWEAFVNGIRDESLTIPTTIKFNFYVDSEQEERAAARFLQRQWRAWQAYKRFHNLQKAVTMLKLAMLKRILWSVIATVQSEAYHVDEKHPAVAALLWQMLAIRKEASAAMNLLQANPFDLLKSRKKLSQRSREATAAHNPPGVINALDKVSAVPRVNSRHMQLVISSAEVAQRAVQDSNEGNNSRPREQLRRMRSKSKRSYCRVNNLLFGDESLAVLRKARKQLGVFSLCKTNLLQQVEAASMLSDQDRNYRPSFDG